MRNKGFTTVELLGVFVVVLVAGAMLPIGRSSGHHHPSAQNKCVNQLKQIQLALGMYAQDYDNVLPAAEAAGGLREYIRVQDRPYISRCPGSSNGGYALGGNIAGQPLEKLGDVCTVVTTWEFDTGSGRINFLVHNDGSNLGFADGHVKWLAGKDRVVKQYYDGPTYIREGGETLARGIRPIRLTF